MATRDAVRDEPGPDCPCHACMIAYKPNVSAPRYSSDNGLTWTTRTPSRGKVRFSIDGKRFSIDHVATWRDLPSLAIEDDRELMKRVHGKPDPRSTDNSDGHLEADDYARRHPDFYSGPTTPSDKWADVGTYTVAEWREAHGFPKRTRMSDAEYRVWAGLPKRKREIVVTIKGDASQFVAALESITPPRGPYRLLPWVRKRTA